MRDMVINLIKYNGYTTDDDGNSIPVKESKEVFAEKRSVGQNEFFQAGQQKLKPQFVIEIFEYDYDDERVAEVDGKEYTIYRNFVAYRKRAGQKSYASSEKIELYCEERVEND